MIIFLGDDVLYRDLIKKSKYDRDIVVSCQYRHLVPKSLVESYDCINIHYGLLPKYAGCNPIYWQMLDGEAGVTVHYMDERFDTGDIITQASFEVDNMTADEVYSALRKIGSSLFESVYEKIIKGTAPRIKQDLSNRVYRRAEDVNFNEVKYIKNLKDAFAVSFEGKQRPIIEVKGRLWELAPLK